jgi:diadenosine tetraphosphate (Ap4A) HIT family hydrolase
LVVADGRAAGQSVFHTHLHVIPRHAGDGFGFRRPLGVGRMPSRQEMDSVAQQVRAGLNG